MTLSDRDRRILLILGIFLGCVLVYIVASWAFGGMGGGSVAAKEDELSRIILLYRTFQQTKSDFSTAERDMQRAGDFELLSELETLADRAQVKGNILSMDKKTQAKNPYYEEETVEVKLEKLTIVQMMGYLYELEYSPKVLRVRELHVEVRFDSKDQMNVRILVSKFAKKAGAAAPAAPAPGAAAG